MNCSYILAFLGILLSLSGVAQEIQLNSLSLGFEQYKKQALQEKVFVHTDRSFYLAGETVWFKIYLTEGSDHKPLDLSKVVYVEVLDQENRPAAKAKVLMEKGIGKGSFYMPLSLKSGSYTLRAYTHYMKNYPPDFFFSKHLTLLNTFLSPDFASPEPQGLVQLTFFPEGGELVSGIKSKTAFKVTAKDGKGTEAKGVIINSNGDTLVHINTENFGLGHFFITPQANETYEALIKGGTDSIQSFKLPAAREKGFVMQLERGDEEKAKIMVQTNLDDQFVYLLVHTRQEIKHAEFRKTSEGKASFEINKKKLGEGISHITLFDQERNPVAERLFFKYPESTFSINAKTDKAKYAPGEKVSVKINPQYASKQQPGTMLSMAVYMADSLSEPQKSNIESYLLLTSDLKGEIESPSFYFQNPGEKTAEAMDNLMLTHGWRRFRWEDVRHGDVPHGNALQSRGQDLQFIPEYEGHIIQAVIEDRKTGTPVQGVASYLSALGKPVQFYASLSNEKGEVRFVTEQLYGERSIILQNLPARNDLRIRLKNSFSEEYPSLPATPLLLPAAGINNIRRRHVYMQAQNIYWQDQRNRLIAPELDSTSFFGQPDKSYLLDNYTRFTTMEEVMREYVYEVRVRKQRGDYFFKIYDPKREMFFTDVPLVLLDGFPVSDINKIMAYNPLKTERLEVVTDRFIIGNEIVYDGIVSYTTFTGDMEGFPFDPDIVKLDYEGLQLQREFYSPDYNSGKQKSTTMPDFRTLLHWAPEIRTGENGEAELSFFTSDLKGKFIMEIQGLSQEGKAGAETIFFEVGEDPL